MIGVLGKRKGTILVMAAIFMLILVTMVGFIIDVARVQLAKIQLHTVVDSVALAAATNLEYATYAAASNRYWLTSPTGNGWGCLYPTPGIYYWNSTFPPSGGWPTEKDANEPYWAERPSFANSCASVYDVVDVFTRLFSPDTVTRVQFRNFSDAFNPYQFRDLRVEVAELQDASTGAEHPSIRLVGTATVDLIFGHLIGMKSVPIAVESETTIELY